MRVAVLSTCERRPALRARCRASDVACPLELPWGLIDEGGEPVEAAVRELEEETGYRADSVEHLSTFQPMVGMVDSEHVVFVGRDGHAAASTSREDQRQGQETGPDLVTDGSAPPRCNG